MSTVECQKPIVSICIPISESKSYSFMDFARGIFELDYPKNRIQIVFALDDWGADNVEKKIKKFVDLWKFPTNCSIVTTTLKGNDVSTSDIIPWKTRARFAAELRNLYTKYVTEFLPETEYIFSVGSDIVLEPNSLKVLLNMGEKVASGLYVSRIQERPLALSYSDGKWDYLEVDLASDEPFKADWTGLDCALIHRDVFSEINWDGFSVDKYGIGEDGYFYLEAASRGHRLNINPQVKPLHVQESGHVVCAKPVPSFGLHVTCFSCGWMTKIGKLWKDISIQCPVCKSELWVDPFWVPRVCDPELANVGIPSSLT